MFQKLFYKTNRNAEPVFPLELLSVGYSYCDPHYSHNKKILTIRKNDQLFWFTKGKAFVLQQGSYSRVRKGHVAIVPKGAEADFYTDDSACEFWSMSIGGFAVANIIDGLNLDLSKPINAGPCPEDKMNVMQNNIQQLVPFYEYQNSVLLYDLLLHIKNTSSKQQAVKPKQMDSLVKQALRLLDNNFADPNLGVNELTGILKISRSTFLNLFKTETGTTPKEYLNSKRLQKIIQLLQDTNFPIIQIAALSGFQNANYMTKFFRKKMNMSPSNFKEKSSQF